jgi:hypothetical protein
MSENKENRTFLHVITPFYRYENFQEIYESIKKFPDLIWHIGVSKKKPFEIDFYDDRIRIHEIDCEDNEAWMKRSEVLEKINDGYFCFLDDDSVFHEGMYQKFLEISQENFKGLVIGVQIKEDNSLRLKSSIPIHAKIDAGNAFAHSNCLSHVKWPKQKAVKNFPNDFVFWKSVYDFFNEKCILTDDVISYYNKLKK